MVVAARLEDQEGDMSTKPFEKGDLVTVEDKFCTIAAEIGKLVAEKNRAYGASFNRAGDILAILYPDGIKTDQYVDALGIVRVIDKMFRIATDRDALGESPWKDIAGYGILGAARAKTCQNLPTDRTTDHQLYIGDSK